MTKFIPFPCILLLFVFYCHAQDHTESGGSCLTENYAKPGVEGRKGQNVRIGFYNVENLYDPYDDTLKLDDEFTSSGAKHWTYSRFRVKLLHLAKMIISMGTWDPPPIFGMCEVENRYVLNKLIYETPLKIYKYKVIQFDSPDARGVDAVMIYRPGIVRIIRAEAIPVIFPFDTSLRTRDILHVQAVVFGDDTIHLFVNHWPSRRGGYKETSMKREFVAGLLKSRIDSIFSLDPLSCIVVMGDFNDEPDNESIAKTLGARTDSAGCRDGALVNLMAPKMQQWDQGTIKYQGKWSVFDQFMVSCPMVSGKSGIVTTFEDCHIHAPAFLVEEDPRFLGTMPKRTYAGPRYTGGFSDHLPIYLDVWKKND
jgi:hypothetical protein